MGKKSGKQTGWLVCNHLERKTLFSSVLKAAFRRQGAGWGQGQSDPGQVNMGGYYGYGQGYEGYGYAHPAQEAPAYAYTGYPGYGNYPQQTS